MSDSGSVVDLEERTWLAKHLQGDKTAFPKLMNTFRKPVYSFLSRYGLEASVCDDLFQNSFLNIHKAANRYDPARPLGPWIFTIVLNVMRNHWRQREINTVDNDALGELSDPFSSQESHSQESQLHYARMRIWLQQALKALPPIQTEALVLTTLQGFQIKDVAEILNLPVNTVKTHIRRARLSLTAALNQQGPQYSDEPSRSIP